MGNLNEQSGRHGSKHSSIMHFHSFVKSCYSNCFSKFTEYYKRGDSSKEVGAESRHCRFLFTILNFQSFLGGFKKPHDLCDLWSFWLLDLLFTVELFSPACKRTSRRCHLTLLSWYRDSEVQTAARTISTGASGASFSEAESFPNYNYSLTVLRLHQPVNLHFTSISVQTLIMYGVMTLNEFNKKKCV